MSEENKQMCGGGGPPPQAAAPAPAPPPAEPAPEATDIGAGRKKQDQAAGIGPNTSATRIDRSAQGGVGGGSGLNM